MSSLFFSAEEREFIDQVLVDAMRVRRERAWWIVRFAISQSLKLGGVPEERYGIPPVRAGYRSELEMEQITGFGKEDSLNYDDAFRLILSVHHELDLFDDDRRYLDLLQRHARRGLEFMRSAWLSDRSYYDYLLDELYSGPDFHAAIATKESETALTLDVGTVMQGLRQLGVKAAPVDAPIQGPRLTRFELTLGGVEDYDRLRRGLDDLAFAMGLGLSGISMARGYGERRVVLDIPRPGSTWKDIQWPSIASALKGRDEALPVSPGADVLGRPVIFDLAEAPHLFIAGATGSGKSVCLNALLVSLMVAARPPELLMIDPKGIDFVDFSSYKRLRLGHVITDMSEGVEALRALVSEMEQRQVLLRDHGARNIAEAQASGVAIERLVVVIDELADFMLSRTGGEEALIRLAQKARAAGIHLLLATQRPEAATFSGLLRANVPSRIALTVQKATDSRIILDDTGAEKLLMRGDMLIKLAGRDLQRAHGARVTPRDVEEALRPRI
ncbi:MAG: FtsK/SpoIIIE domain-containing protein [Dyella sp.]|uniref:FtsK/SpoIIIE domain-containing protein n=1 Tax=Dyella sp. TaxID=1869338 RepID=UPI003F81BAB5